MECRGARSAAIEAEGELLQVARDMAPTQAVLCSVAIIVRSYTGEASASKASIATAISTAGRVWSAAAIRRFSPGVHVDDHSRNKILVALRTVAERGNALLKSTWRALRLVTLDPTRLTEITTAALVLLHLHAETGDQPGENTSVDAFAVSARVADTLDDARPVLPPVSMLDGAEVVWLRRCFQVTPS